MADKITTSDAQNTLKAIAKESISLEASSIISLYEIDLSTIKTARNIGLTDILPDILRFHNEESFGQKQIYFRGDVYHPMPINAAGFEASSTGSLPRPTLTIAPFLGILEESVSEETARRLAFTSLKRAILEVDNMIGAKVSRIRTFYKFLDASNNLEGVGEFTSGTGNNPEFPKESFYVERKMSEDKNGMQFELSSVLDMENFSLPGRICLANRCPWVYRGEGCAYEFKAKGVASRHGATEHLPDFAPPTANDQDKLLTGIITGSDGASLYDPTTVTNTSVFNYTGELGKDYAAGDVIYISQNDINYYYVAKKTVPDGHPPPHTEYWEADRCSKSLDGCRLRWGTGGSAKNTLGAAKVTANKFLPFGGFPGTNTNTSIQ